MVGRGAPMSMVLVLFVILVIVVVVAVLVTVGWHSLHPQGCLGAGYIGTHIDIPATGR
jgi:hypothetical protein